MSTPRHKEHSKDTSITTHQIQLIHFKFISITITPLQSFSPQFTQSNSFSCSSFFNNPILSNPLLKNPSSVVIDWSSSFYLPFLIYQNSFVHRWTTYDTFFFPCFLCRHFSYLILSFNLSLDSFFFFSVYTFIYKNWVFYITFE